MHDLPTYSPRRPVEQRQPRMKDRAYLDSFKGRECEACGVRNDTVVGAHVRTGLEGGMSRKPDDPLVVALCGRCHDGQSANPGAEWWMRVFKRMLKLRHKEWVMAR